MLVAEEAVEFRVLRRQGKSIRAIARMLDVSRNTVRRYLRVEGLPVRFDRTWSLPIATFGTLRLWAQRFFEFRHPSVLKVLHCDSHVIEDLVQHVEIRDLVFAARTSLGQNPYVQPFAFGDQLHGAGYTS
jgi:hypothetical protein